MLPSSGPRLPVMGPTCIVSEGSARWQPPCAGHVWHPVKLVLSFLKSLPKRQHLTTAQVSRQRSLLTFLGEVTIPQDCRVKISTMVTLLE